MKISLDNVKIALMLIFLAICVCLASRQIFYAICWVLAIGIVGRIFDKD